MRSTKSPFAYQPDLARGRTAAADLPPARDMHLPPTRPEQTAATLERPGPGQAAQKRRAQAAVSRNEPAPLLSWLVEERVAPAREQKHALPAGATLSGLPTRGGRHAPGTGNKGRSAVSASTLQMLGGDGSQDDLQLGQTVPQEVRPLSRPWP
jgi:hypothetical protein